MELLAIEKHAVKMAGDVVHVLNTENAASDDSELCLLRTLESPPTRPACSASPGVRSSRPKPGRPELIREQAPQQHFHRIPRLPRPGHDSQVLPYEFVVDPSKPTGAGVRLVVGAGRPPLSVEIKLISYRLIEPLWFFVIGSAISSGKLTAPQGWHRVKWIPRRVTVDAASAERTVRT